MPPPKTVTNTESSNSDSEHILTWGIAVGAGFMVLWVGLMVVLYKLKSGTVESASPYDPQTIEFFNKNGTNLALRGGKILKQQMQDIVINLQNYELYEIPETLTPGINYGKVTITGFHSLKDAMGNDMAKRMKCFEKIINAFGTMDVEELEIVGFLHPRSRVHPAFDYNYFAEEILGNITLQQRILNTKRLTLIGLPESFLTQIVQAYYIPERFTLTVRGSDATSFSFLSHFISIPNMKALELTSFWALKEVGNTNLQSCVALNHLVLRDIPVKSRTTHYYLNLLFRYVTHRDAHPVNLESICNLAPVTLTYQDISVEGIPLKVHIIDDIPTRKKKIQEALKQKLVNTKPSM
ncbi:hypothetical protein NEDG_00917 [Nematocida displodere]|uniref:Uncharacterized protein n=1 Tax=Nematocida displodere TaxID=1805483 RepID=A0A177EAF5_9MICR|nr:hypothetical protein NEDG_00917 [Nematocida displodere]